MTPLEVVFCVETLFPFNHYLVFAPLTAERGIHCTSQCPPSNVCCRSHITHSVSLSSVQVPSPGQCKQWGPCPSVELNVYTALYHGPWLMSQCSEAVWLSHVPCYQVLHQHSVSHVRPDILTTHTASNIQIWGVL